MNRNDLVLRRGAAIVALGADLRWEVIADDGTAPPAIIGAAWAGDPWALTAEHAAADGWIVLLAAKHPWRSAAGAPVDADF